MCRNTNSHPLRGRIMDAVVRVEVDLPVVIVNQYGGLTLDNHKGLSDVVGPYFHNGDVLSVHMVIESTGEHRDFCKFVDETSTYKSKCGNILDTDGTCWLEEQHEKARVKQLELSSTYGKVEDSQ